MIESTTGWAPVVHARTYRVDFRPHLLVVPDWFTDDDITAVREYIRASTRSAERLPDAPRWLLMKTGRFQVAGVTCMAGSVSADMTHDRPDPGSGGSGRPLYVFLGWATRDLAADPPPMDLDVYKQLYQFVRNRWDNAPPDDAADTVGPLVERFPNLPHDPKIAQLTPDPEAHSSYNHALSVWPDSRRATLWASIARHRGPVSLCIGMARSRDAEESPLGNITVAGSDESVTLDRTPKQPVSTPSGRYTPEGRHIPTSDTRPGDGYTAEPGEHRPPRRQSVAVSVLEMVFKAIESVLHMIGIGSRTPANVPPATPQPPATPVGMDQILRPVRPSEGRPKASAFDAFGTPPPRPTHRSETPTATDKTVSPPPASKLSNDERLDQTRRRNMGQEDAGTSS
jgi:hypothetical protein